MPNYIAQEFDQNSLSSLWRLEKIILDTLDFNEVIQKVVDGVLLELGYLKLGYRIVVLALADEKQGILRRISVSRTDAAKKALELLPIPFPQLDIPLNSTNNLCIKVLTSGNPESTTDWKDILTPPLTDSEAKDLQAAVGIKTSFVYPLISKQKAIGIMIFSMSKVENEVTPEERKLIQNYTDVVALAVQNAQLYSSLSATTDKLKRANVRLQELDQIKDEFVSLASHELRTPMTAIKSYLWMVLNKNMQPLDDKVRTYIFRAYDSTERLIRLVQDMLTVSRIEGKRMELRMSDFDLYQLEKEIVDEIKVKAGEKSVVINLTPLKETIMLHADRDKIEEVILNLLGNAVKFTPSGGSITLSSLQKDQMVQVSVKDTGSGISNEDKAKLFQKFSRLEHSYTKMAETTGTGLGLYICRQIVSLHGGKIWVDSEVGKGSTFIFSIPRNSSSGGIYA